MVFLTVETLVTVLLVNSKLERKLYRGSNPCDVRNARLSSCLVEKTTLCQTHCDKITIRDPYEANFLIENLLVRLASAYALAGRNNTQVFNKTNHFTRCQSTPFDKNLIT